jgi:ABC-type Fe3+ transport system substrate-binding protein
VVTIGVAYGTEKKQWLERAVEQFRETPDGKRYGVKLIGMGSLEAAHAILKGDETIHVWSPASSLYRYQLVDEWKIKRTGDPIAASKQLALTPMVFVFWDKRHDAFVAKYKQASFRTVAQALAEPGGWTAIANQSQWGLFKFGHTDPNQSNSGLMTLVLEAYDYHQKNSGLSLGDITDVGFQKWVGGLYKGVSGLSNSTGNMMLEMVQRGPSTYDALFVYESTAIEYAKSAAGRWGNLRVVYPERNAWNDNPYYILNVPWSSPEHRKGAEKFMEFLLSEPIQAAALEHGFRPAEVKVPINGPDSPFTLYATYGLQIDLPSVCEPPPPEVISNLLLNWQRSRP